MDSKTEEHSVAHFTPSITGQFLPSLIISLGYGLIWLWLYSQGQGGGALARLSLAVVLLIVPLLIAYGVLKQVTTYVDVFGSYVKVNRGIANSGSAELPFAFIERVDIVYGLLGRITNSATVRINLSSGKVVSIAGIDRPNQLKSMVDEACAKLSG